MPRLGGRGMARGSRQPDATLPPRRRQPPGPADRDRTDPDLAIPEPERHVEPAAVTAEQRDPFPPLPHPPPLKEPPRRTPRRVREETPALQGARVADIGCGDGALGRLMTRLGARATGIDPSEGQLGRARAAEPAGDEDYLRGLGEALPLPDAVLDVAVFFNALHHVPVEHQGAALAEAARALKTGGRLYVVEPVAQGPHFSVTRRIEDETRVRAKAYEALAAAAPARKKVGLQKLNDSKALLGQVPG